MDDTESEKPEYAGMTVNERLFAAGLLEQFREVGYLTPQVQSDEGDRAGGRYDEVRREGPDSHPERRGEGRHDLGPASDPVPNQ